MMITLQLLDISCASCVNTIETALQQTDGVKTAKVNFAERAVTIEGNISAATAIEVIAKAGYKASDTDNNADLDKQTQQHYHRLLRYAFVSGALGIGILIMGLLPPIPTINQLHGRSIWFAVGLITITGMSYAGRHFFYNAWNAFWHHQATMDTLIAIGTGAAWVYSMVIIIIPALVPQSARHVYFEAALIIIALVNLGQALEMRARGKTSQAIQHLQGLQAKTANKVNPDGSEQQVLIKAIKTNDIIRVKPGEKIPVDGIIVEGSSTIDESMITGEPIPATKKNGDKVIGSTINKSGSFLLKTTQVGEQTALAQIIQLVKSAQNTKPPVARLADTVSGIFVPIVLIIAVITALIWFNIGFSGGFILVATMTVLVIACPCALGLATPISVMVGMGKAAEHGVLIRNGEALQKSCQLTTIVLDKTGTITKGQPEVTDVFHSNNFSEDSLLQLVASAEQNSEHPLALAILEKAKQQSLHLFKTSEFNAIEGHGLKAIIQQQQVLIGNSKLMLDQQIAINEFQTNATELENQAKTVIFVSVDNQCAGLIAITDPIKADARKAIAQLQQMGLTVMMLTGDNQVTANAVAESVGISKAIANVLPQDKEKAISDLQSKGHVVGMVGDGINDAPALAKADVGFAIGAGTDVAIESADITLIGSSLQGVSNAILVSKATLKNIKQNLVGAFLYNTIGIPIAAGVLYPLLGVLLNPMIAGAAMAASSLTVVSNANRLRFLKVKKLEWKKS